MRRTIKQNLSYNDADRLIEKYYEGLSTVDEEKELKNFLSLSGLPERYEPEQAIFGYFNQNKVKKHFSIQPFIRWASVAAVILVAVFSMKVFMVQNITDYAYVDGRKITNVKEVKAQAMASLSDISSENNEVEDGIKNLNDKKLIDQQLDVFSGLE